MHVIQARNVNDAYRQGMQLISAQGIRQPSRAGEVLALERPVTTVYERPMERVLFDSKRDANPIFHLMESIWMLAGWRDATWLDQFVGDFSKRFAEDNGNAHGAYGYRWRDHFLRARQKETKEDLERMKANPIPGEIPLPTKIDQILECGRILLNDPTSRQAVMAMWDPAVDLGAKKRDIPCFAGDVPLWSPEGDLSFAEVAAKFSEGSVSRWPVYAVDMEKKTVSLQWASNVWCSGRKKTIKLSFDDGSSIRVTSDHILYKRYNSVRTAFEIKAGELQVGDRILATSRFYSPKGHELHKKNLGDNTNFGNMIKTHQEYAKLLWGTLPEGKEIHHKNEVKTDNRADNLEYLTPGEHSRLHRLGDRNPMRNMTPEQHRKRAEKQSASIKEFYNKQSEEEHQVWLSKQREGVKKYRSAVDNHRITAIEECDEELVYDFTVENGHNALVGTGVVAHNCNDMIMFRGRYDHIDQIWLLDTTVLCRSNDIIWGAYGANAVHMSFMAEVVAALAGMKMGRYYQVSNNYHAYLNIFTKIYPPVCPTGPYSTTIGGDMYQLGMAIPRPLFGEETYVFKDRQRLSDRGVEFLNACEAFMNDRNISAKGPIFFDDVVFPLMRAHRDYWKQGKKLEALDLVRKMPASDWQLATMQWMGRRLASNPSIDVRDK